MNLKQRVAELEKLVTELMAIKEKYEPVNKLLIINGKPQRINTRRFIHGKKVKTYPCKVIPIIECEDR